MARTPRVDIGDVVHHVINRGNGRARIFHSDADYAHFEALLLEAVELTGMRILAYCLMPNHWHLVLYPHKDGDIGRFMHWLTTTHVRQRRVQTDTIGHGHLYQGAYKCFPVETNEYCVAVLRYVEQNAWRAKLVQRAEAWRWASTFRRRRGRTDDKKLLAQLPIELPRNYVASLNIRYDDDVLTEIRHTIKKSAPFGSDGWVERMAREHHMESTLRDPGRPRA